MKRKNETFTQLVVGFFMVTLMALLAYFTIVVSGVDLMTGRSRIKIRAVFTQVGGLKDHDNVMYRGTKVGSVVSVEVTPSNLVVTAMVDGGVILRTGCSASVCNLSMLGGNYLLLEEGEGEIVSLSEVLVPGETPTDWMRDVARIAKNLNEITSGPEIRSMITNFQAVSAKAKVIADRVAAFSERLEKFAQRADDISEKVYAVVDRVERGEGTVGKLLSNDDTVYRDMKDTFANAKEISGRLSHGKALDDLEAGIAAFRTAAEGFDAKDTMAKANKLLDSLNAVAADLRDGNGTLGRLAKDPGLYEEVDGLVRDVRQVIDNYRDTTPISTFSSLAIGAF